MKRELVHTPKQIMNMIEKETASMPKKKKEEVEQVVIRSLERSLDRKDFLIADVRTPEEFTAEDNTSTDSALKLIGAFWVIDRIGRLMRSMNPFS